MLLAIGSVGHPLLIPGGYLLLWFFAWIPRVKQVASENRWCQACRPSTDEVPTNRVYSQSRIDGDNIRLLGDSTRVALPFALGLPLVRLDWLEQCLEIRYYSQFHIQRQIAIFKFPEPILTLSFTRSLPAGHGGAAAMDTCSCMVE